MFFPFSLSCNHFTTVSKFVREFCVNFLNSEKIWLCAIGKIVTIQNKKTGHNNSVMSCLTGCRLCLDEMHLASVELDINRQLAVRLFHLLGQLEPVGLIVNARHEHAQDNIAVQLVIVYPTTAGGSDRKAPPFFGQLAEHLIILRLQADTIIILDRQMNYGKLRHISSVVVACPFASDSYIMA